ncbi:hypothetical protein JCM9140_4667 [Halalkalibacter wakoensis JCM 9140]|uniref:Uncharacterized protein n=1 Tax=Halalkalibacter wakoensis JCM 9140 TaxID=1236970 RepID=W4Q908_9BACI|nr:competence type IV pilus minor pilin ComGF [Halalkalibacter wakoensis]GAE28442.1 hypothetical protein JCM9140_4667 [Halalkalibacter wakoensis JCM 9140]
MRHAFLRLGHKGFSLVELLMALSIFLVLVSFFPTLTLIRTNGYQTDPTSSQQVMTFFNQLAHDVRESDDARLNEGRLQLVHYTDDVLEIELMPSKQLRRTRNREGHNLLLENVKSFSCQIENKLVACSIELLNGYKESKTMLMAYVRGGRGE